MSHDFVDIVIPTLAESNLLRHILSGFPTSLLTGHASEAVALAEKLGAEQSSQLVRLGSKLRALIEHTGPMGVVVIDLSAALQDYLTQLPATPRAFCEPRYHVLNALDMCRCVLIGSAGGYSYSYRDQAMGNLCDDVMPRREDADTVGVSYGKELGWHTEDAPYNRTDDDAAHPTYDVLSIAYLRNPHSDCTLVSMPDFSAISPSVLEQLRRRQFITLTSFAQQGDANAVMAPNSLVYGTIPSMRFTFARAHEQLEYYEKLGLSNAIRAFISHLDAHRASLSAQPGHIAFIDNMRVAHARGAWTSPPKLDGSDRWQRRLGVAAASRRPAIELLMERPESRVIDNTRLLEYFRRLIPTG